MKQSELKDIIKECVAEVMLEEGMFDRLKSRASGVGASAKYAVKGGLDKIDSKLFGSPRDEYNAEKNKTLAKNNYQITKIESYQKIANKKIDKLASEIMEDLKKLGIDTKGLSEKQINFFKSSMNKALQELIDTIPGKGVKVGW